MKPMCLMMRLFSKAAACPVTEVVTGPGVEAGDPLPLPLGLLGFRSHGLLLSPKPRDSAFHVTLGIQLPSSGMVS